MKVMRLFAASAVSAALAASMALSASATTYSEVVEKAESLGLDSTNLQTLSNYLESNQSTFTSSDYDSMISKIETTYDTYVQPILDEKYPGKTYAELTDEEKADVKAEIPTADKDSMKSDLKTFCASYGITVEVADGGTVTVETTTSTESGAAANKVAVTKAVAGTGSEVESDVNSGLIACAGLALVVAASGLVIVSKKNKA